MAGSLAATKSDTNLKPSGNGRTPRVDVDERAAHGPGSSLPRPSTDFIGREGEVEEVRSLLLDESVRLLTLTGLGGVGKTRLALQVALALRSEFEDGVHFVSLSSLNDPRLVLPTVAGVFGVTEDGATPLAEKLQAHLSDKGLLLILDNFEHVASAAHAIACVLSGAPGVQVVVTSRVPLRLNGEHLFTVPTLPTPEADEKMRYTPEQLFSFSAVRLFTERAGAVRPGFALTGANAWAVSRICSRLDGLPLALELAAARSRLFSPDALLSRLDRALPLLTGGTLDLPDRQRTLRNTIAWSYNLLEPIEQVLFARLSVFAGGSTLDGAARVASDLGLEEGELLDLLTSLIDKSLLGQREEPDGEPRFRMLATIREFALEKLAEAPDAEMVHLSHAEFYTGLAEQFDAEARGPKFESWLGRLERDHDNVRVALHWLTRQDSPYSELAMRLAGSFFWFWFTRGYINEGRFWLAKVAAFIGEEVPGLPEELRLKRASIYNNAGALAGTQGDYAQASVMLTKSLEIVRSLGNDRGIARTLNNLGIFAAHQGLYREAEAYFAESLHLKLALQDDHAIASAYNRVAEIAQIKGEYERSEELYGKALALRQASEDKLRVAETLNNLAGLYYVRGDLVRAISYGRDSLDAAREIDYKEGVTMAILHLAPALYASGQRDQAVLLIEECLHLSRSIGDQSTHSLALKRMAEILAGQEDYGAARRFLEQSLQIRFKLREYNVEMVACLEWLAYVDAIQSVQDGAAWARRAVTLMGAAEARRESMGTPVVQVDRARHTRVLGELRGSLSPAEFADAWQAGRALSIDEATALALRELEAEGTAEEATAMQTAPSDLTRREVSVLQLAAQGLTNKEIAERLTLSHRTVQNHLYSIFNKLDVTTRSAATRLALERRLV
jgi:predicted ATPase/DNA-binding CsgD family transcriptional regulator/Tfp pilus assembly protein PilF